MVVIAVAVAVVLVKGRKGMGFGGFWVLGLDFGLGFGVLGFWGFGVLGFWGFGVLGFWGLGLWVWVLGFEFVFWLEVDGMGSFVSVVVEATVVLVKGKTGLRLVGWG